MPVNELVKKIIADTRMREAYADESDESINKRANIEEFINSVEEYCRLNPDTTLTDYLNQVTLSSDTDEMDEGNYVTLATVHSVKGLEFKCVFICGWEENILPVSRAVYNDDDMEEERRLMYVAITRAQELLYLTRSKSRYLYGKREPTARSRFLKELASEVDLPREARRPSYGYDEYDDDYGSYGGRKNSYGGSYGGGYGGNYGNRSGGSAWQNSGVTRSKWNGNSYGNSYGSYGAGTSRSVKNESGGFTYGGLGKPQKPANPASGKDVSGLRIGVCVQHPKFGAGTIVGTRGVGNNMILDVAFEGLGIKQLSATLAPLTII